ncbi:hypothetical protein AB0395_11595 [Streptosporangium sp. NPDC051023]|uniref:hypothetical protein n=1 Tax=Streptosporangium sp. NPDC051023 TaxID=3155410 RepID=UPI00344C437C
MTGNPAEEDPYGPGRGPGAVRLSQEALFLERMVEDRRLVIRLRVSRLYGIVLDLP